MDIASSRILYLSDVQLIPVGGKLLVACIFATVSGLLHLWALGGNSKGFAMENMPPDLVTMVFKGENTMSHPIFSTPGLSLGDYHFYFIIIIIIILVDRNCFQCIFTENEAYYDYYSILFDSARGGDESLEGKRAYAGRSAPEFSCGRRASTTGVAPRLPIDTIHRLQRLQLALCNLPFCLTLFFIRT